MNQIAPYVNPYIRENPRISYVQPEDPWVVQKIISAVEVLFGRNKVESIYHQLKAQPFNIHQFFNQALAAGDINIEFNPHQLNKIPASGPLVFVANHPFGVVDGIVLCHLALQARQDFRIMLHSLLCQDRDLAEYFLPVDFVPTKTAQRNNIRSKQEAIACLKRGIPVLIFPSGMVATAKRWGFGEVQESPWSTFAAKIIRSTNATVVPVRFYGQNSRKFHVASYIAEPLRMALIIHEALNKFGQTIRVEVGDPLSSQELSAYDSRQALTEFLYQHTTCLSGTISQ